MMLMGTLRQLVGVGFGQARLLAPGEVLCRGRAVQAAPLGICHLVPGHMRGQLLGGPCLVPALACAVQLTGLDICMLVVLRWGINSLHLHAKVARVRCQSCWGACQDEPLGQSLTRVCLVRLCQ